MRKFTRTVNAGQTLSILARGFSFLWLIGFLCCGVSSSFGQIYTEVTNASGSTAVYGSYSVTVTTSAGGTGGSCSSTAVPYSFPGSSSYTFTFSSSVSSVQIPSYFTPSNGSVSISINGSPYSLAPANLLSVVTPSCLSDANEEVISGGSLSPGADEGGNPSGLVQISGPINTITLTSTTASFVFGMYFTTLFNNGISQSLPPVCENSGATSLSSLLAVTEATGKTDTWKVIASTPNASFSGFPASAPTSTNATPANVTYTPAPGFSGIDSFTVQVSDGSDSTTTKIHVTVNPTPAVFSGTTICSTSSTTLTDATSPGTWSSNNPAVASIGSTTGTITGGASGTATISYSLTTGCYTTAIVSVNPLPASISNAGAPFCQGSGVTVADITSTGTWASSNISVATIGTAGNIAGLSGGTSTISYTLPTGCMMTAIVTVNPKPAAITGTQGMCVGNTTSLADGTSAGTWSSGTVAVATIGSGTGIATGVSSGTSNITYTLTATGCSVTAPVTVSTTPNIYAITGGGGYCAGSAGAPVGLSMSDIGVSYQIYNSVTPFGAPFAGIGAPATLATETAPGTYIIVATHSTGCTATMSGSVTVTVNPVPTVYSVSGGGTLCSGGSGYSVLLGGSALGVNYQLYLNGSSTGSPVSGTGTALTMGTETAAGTYTVLASNATTTCTANMSGNATVSVNPLPVSTYSVTGTGNYCLGSSGLPVGLSNSTAGISYQLYLNGVATGGAVISGGGVITFGTETSGGTYTVTGQNTATGCTATMTGSAIVTISAPPTVFSVTGGGNYCAGSATGVAVGLNASTPGVNYQLFINSAPAATLAGSGTALSYGLETTVGAYTIVASNAATACSVNMSGSVTVSTNPLPAVNNVTGGGGYCAGGSGIAIGLNGSVAGNTYSLYNGATLITAAAGTGFPVAFGNELVAGTYTVSATSSAGCINAMAGNAVVTVNPLPTSYALTGGGVYCTGGTGAAVGVSNTTSGVNYQLELGGIYVGAPYLSSGGAYSFGLQTGTGIYTVLAYNTATGCQQLMPGSVTVTVNPLPYTRTVTGGGSFCAGGTGVHVGLNTSDAGINYQLYNPSAVGTYRSGVGAAIDFGLQATPGVYTVVGTNATTQCSVNMLGSVIVTTNPLPATYAVTGGGGYCPGGSGVNVQLASSATGVNYQLYVNGAATGSAIAGATGNALNFGLQATTGTYTIIGANATTLCTANMSGSATVTVNALPTAFNVTGGGSYCTGGTGLHVMLSSSSAGVGYQLYLNGSPVGSSKPGTGSLIDFGAQAAAGTYTVIATNSATSCVNAMNGSAAITINSLPAAFAVTGGGDYCAGGAGVAIGLANSVIGVNYQLYSAGVAIGAAQPGLGTPITFGTQTLAGSYTVLATVTATSCTNNMTGGTSVVIQPLPPTHSLTGGGVFCIGGTGAQIGLSGSDTGIGYRLYLGSTGVGALVDGSGLAISFGSVTTAGDYSVIATNNTTSCTSVMPGMVNVSAGTQPIAYSVTGGGAYCANGTGVAVGLSHSDIGVNYQLFNGTDTLGITYGTGLPVSFGLQTTAGTYTVIATNTSSTCISNMTGNALISINPLPATDSVTGGGSYCAGGSGVAIGLYGSDTGATYQLFYGASPAGLPLAGTGHPLSFGSYLAAGTYSVTATTNTTGCSNAMGNSVSIAINPLPATYTVTGGGAYCSGGSGVNVGLMSSDPGVTYQLYNGVMVAGSQVIGDGSAINFGLQTGAGTYTVIATTDSSSCAANMLGSAAVTTNALPFAYNVTGGGSYCMGGAGVHIALSSSATGVSYQLMMSGGGSVGTAVAGTGAGIDLGLQTMAGTYYIQATNTATGCTNVMSDSAVVSYRSVPAIYTLTSSASFYCAGGSGVALQLSGSDAGTVYQLYLGSATTGTPVSGTGSTLNLGLQTGAGAYSVVATNATGCTSDMAGSLAIAINALPAAYPVVGGGAYCENGAGVHIGLSASTSGISYQLYDGVAMTGSAVMGTGGPIDFGEQTATGVYTVIATNGATTCVSTMPGSATVSINPLPDQYAVTGGGSTCAGGDGLSVGLSNSDAGTTYDLYYSGSLLATLSGTGSALNFGLRTGAGAYVVVAQNTATTCSDTMTGSANIVVNPLPTPYVISGGGNYCAGTTGAPVNLLGSNLGVNYQLKLDGTNVGTPISGTGTSLNFGMQLSAGSYTITATNAATSCSNSMTGSVTISVNPAPAQYSVIGGGGYCVGGAGASIGLGNSTTGVSYQLMHGGANEGAPVLGDGGIIHFSLAADTGLYIVVATNLATGCTDTMSGNATVTVMPLVAPSVTLTDGGVSDTLCSGTAIAFNTLVANGGSTPSYQWYVNGLPVAGTGSSYTFTPENGDSVSVMVTSSAACAAPATVTATSGSRFTIQPGATPAISISVAPGNSVCQYTTVNFTASASFGGPAAEYSWTVNGVAQGAGSVYSYIPGNNDVVQCILTSDYYCRLANTVASNTIEMTVQAPVKPDVTIAALPGTNVAAGEAVMLSAIDAAPTPSPIYQWYINGTLIAGATESTYTSSNFSNLDSISCIETSGGLCGGLSDTGYIVLHVGTEGVAQVNANADITIVPNPNKGIFTIKGSLGVTDDQDVSLEITDMLGQIVYSNKVMAHGGNINERVQLSGAVANGMYLLNVRTAEGANVFHMVIEQ